MKCDKGHLHGVLFCVYEEDALGIVGDAIDLVPNKNSGGVLVLPLTCTQTRSPGGSHQAKGAKGPCRCNLCRARALGSVLPGA